MARECIAPAKRSRCMPPRGGARALPRILAAAMVAAGLALCGLFAGAGQAARADDADAPAATAPGAATALDGLFLRLKQAPDEASAAIIGRMIERRWARSGSDTADLLAQRADKMLESGDRPLAIEILDRVNVLEPEWAEAYNKKATAFYLDGDLARSADGLREALRLEPRQFEALTSLGALLEQIGDEKLALEAYRRVLAIYPLMPAAKKGFDRLKAKYGDVPT